MTLALRLTVGSTGVLSLLVALAWIIAPDRLAPAFGLLAEGALGKASLRADVGGFFAMSGALCLAAAIRRSAALMTGPLVLIIFALSARLISVFLDGVEPGVLAPLAIEAVLAALFAAARLRLGEGPVSSR
jgi:hypothetical protein